MSFGSAIDGGNIVVGLGLDSDQLTQGLHSASDSLAAFTGSAERSLAALARLGPAAASIAAIGLIFKKVTSDAADYQQQLANLNAVLHATTQEQEQLSRVTFERARNTQFSAVDILPAESTLARAGNRPSDIGKQLPDVLDLASASFQSPMQAAKEYTAVTNAFNISVGESKQTVNDLAKAMDSSLLTAAQWQQSLKQSGPVAHALGVDAKELEQTLAGLSLAGMQGDAGTASRTFMQHLQRETPAARKEIEALGLSFYDAAGNFKGLEDAADQLHVKLSVLSEEERGKALTTIFGTRGALAASILTEQGGDLFVEQRDHALELGDASDIARAKLDTLQGSVHKLGSSLNLLSVQAGNDLLPTVRAGTDVLTAFANAIAGINEHAPIVGQEVFGAATVAGLAKVGQMLGDRRASQLDSDAAPYALQREASSRALAAQQQAEAEAEIAWQEKIVQAHFTADSQILAANQTMYEQLDALDRAHEANIIATYQAEMEAIFALQDAKATAAAQSAALDDLALRRKADAELVTFGQQHFNLDQSLDQSAARATLRKAYTDGTITEEEYATFHREQLHFQLSERQTAQTEYNASLKASSDAFAGEEIAIGDAATAREIAAIQAQTDAKVAAMRQSVVQQRTALAEANVSSVANAESAFGNTAASAENALYADQAAAQIAAQRAGSKYTVSTTNVAVTDADRALAQQAKAATQSGVAALGASMGELLMPITIVATLGALVLKPLGDAIDAHFKAGDLKANTQEFDAVFHPNGNISAFDERGLAAAISDAQILQDEMRKIAGGDWKLQGLEEAKKQLQDYQALVANTPGKVKSALSDFSANIVTAFTNSNLSVEQAIKGYDDAIARLLTLRSMITGTEVTPEIQAIAAANRADTLATLNRAAAQRKSDAEDAQVLFADNLASYQHASAIGVDPTTAARSIGYNPDGSDATKLQIKQATDEVKKFEKAWQEAAAAVGSVDIKQGIDNLVKASDKLTQAQAELSRLGIGNTHLDELANIASAFKAISDQEDQAKQSYDGYMLTLNESNKSINFLDQQQQQLDTLVKAAATARDNGTATPGQLQLLREQQNITGNISETKAKLYARETDDFLGIAHTMPDLLEFDGKIRDLVDFMKREEIVIKVSLDTKLATDQIKALTDPNPPYSLTNTGGGNYSKNAGGNAGGGAGGGDFNQFHSLGYDQYLGIVKDGSGSKSSPFANLDTYASVIRAAKEYGIDPRALLAFTKEENGNGTNISPDLIAANNFGGIKFDNQPGATRGPQSPETNKDGSPSYYAAFDNPDRFFETIAANMTTGIYSDLYKQGDLEQVRRTYITGGAQGDPDQERNVANTVGDYNNYVKQYPWPGGGGNMDMGSSASSTGQQVVANAMRDLGMDAFVNECEKWVETKIQEVTGRRGATGISEGDANAALAHAQTMGLERGAGETPQVGDLVYYGDDKNGHVAIYIGNNQQVSTYDHGKPIGDNRDIHTETVGAGAHYVRVPGVTDASGTTTYDEFGQPYVTGGTNRNANGHVDYSQPSGSRPTIKDIEARLNQGVGRSRFDGSELLSILDPILKRLDDKGLAQVDAAALSYGQYAKTEAEQQLGPNAKPEQIAMADQAAQGRTLQFAVAMAKATDDWQNNTGDFVADIQKVIELGGPLGANFANQVVLTKQIADTTKTIADDKKASTDEDRRHTDLLQTWKEEDQGRQRAEQMASWQQTINDNDRNRQDTTSQWRVQDARENEKRAFDEKKRGMDELWTQQDRQWQDKQRQMDFEGTASEKLLNDQLKALDKNEVAARQAGVARQQNLEGLAQSATNVPDKQVAREALAIEKDYDRQQAQNFTTQKEAMKDAIDDQKTLVAQERYDFETQRVAATRKHEDDMKALDELRRTTDERYADEDKSLSRTKQIENWNSADQRLQDQIDKTTADWRRQDDRNAEDKRHADTQRNLQDDITKNETFLKGLDTDLAKTQAIAADFMKNYAIYGSAASSVLDDFAGFFKSAQQAGLLPGTSASAPTGPAPVRKLGGYAAGTSSATPGIHPVSEDLPEVIFKGGESVMRLDTLMQKFAASVTAPAPVYQVAIAIDASSNGPLDEVGRARVRQVVMEEMARVRGASSNTNNDYIAASGGTRLAA